MVLLVPKMLVVGKRKYTHQCTRKTLSEKRQVFKDLENGESSKDKNTLSTWVKNKEKLFDAQKKEPVLRDRN